jgi:hydrogenase-4 membrane subunit HyfE
VSSWDACLALLLTALILRRVSKNPKIQREDKVMVDLCLGLVAVGASVSWLRVLALAWPFG